MFRSSPLLARIVAFIVLPLLLAATLGYMYLRSALPAGGSFTLRAVNGTVSIAQDEQGVPHIRATTDADVFFAMGYLHARDRGWQMELQRRAARGRLSEILGEAALSQDVWYRTLGIQRAAEAALAALSEPARASLNAYAAGVNAWNASGAALAPEMLALGVRPEAWTPADSMATLKMVAHAMAGGMQAELERATAAAYLPPAQLQLLYGPLQLGADTASASSAATLLEQIGTRAPHARSAGSNAWVVSAKRGASALPILANDPHMTLGMPSAWYVVQQSGATLHSQGMSLVGMPLVIFGKNASIAWGGTNMMADTQDLYLEQLRDAGQADYLDHGAWRAFEVRHESINVAPPSPGWLHAPFEPVRIRIRETVRGPVISDANPQLGNAISLRWTALDRADTSYEAFFRLNYASDWEQFRAALAWQVAPVLNMLYADRAGNIGYLGAGRLPLRAQGSGELPRPGWSGQFAWTGFVPAAQMPSLYNPPSGYIVSANERMAAVEYPGFVTLDWAPPYRAQRIEQMIGERKTLDMAAHQAMQQDALALDARELLPQLLKLQVAGPSQRQALQLLRTWDGRMSVDSGAAAIYAAWLARLREEIMAPKMQAFRDTRKNAGLRNAVTRNLAPRTLALILAAPGTSWCAKPGCPDELLRALDSALGDLSRLMGRDLAQWQWGAVHHTYLRHIPFGQASILGSLFERRFAAPGGQYTVAAAISQLNAGNGYEQQFGAVFRQVMEPGEGRHYFINSSGQSGNPVSAHYADMTALYAKGHYLELSNTVEQTQP